MNNRKYVLPIAVRCVCAGFLLPACNGTQQSVTTSTVDSLQVDTTIYLQEGKASPSCHLKLDYLYLKPASEQDTLAQLINQQLLSIAFGSKYAHNSPQEFVANFTNDYLKDYRGDVEELYQADVKNGMTPEDTPSWYNYEYDFQSSLKKGADDVWNYTLLSFMYTGGAHPNTIRQCLNIDATTGALITKESLFDMDHEKEICRLIEQALIKEANQRLDTDTITSVQGLQENGILLDTDLFIPDNFLLKKDGVTFVYNRYEIAPYAAGDFVLTVPMSDLSTYLKVKKQ